MLKSFRASFVATIVIFILAIALGACSMQDEATPVTAGPPGGSVPDEPPEAPVYAATDEGGSLYITLSTLEDAVGPQGWTIQWDGSNRTLELSRGGDYLRVTAGVPVVERNGLFDSLSRALDVSPGGRVLVPVDLLETGLGWQVNRVPAGEDQVSVSVAAEPETWPDVGELPSTADDLVSTLSFLQSPIEGASAGFTDSQVPGAPRDYRNGTHEGFDWYGYRVGVPVDRTTEVHAMAGGTVVRASLNWKTPTPDERNSWLALTLNTESTPQWILDLLRGRQVWIMHENGVLVRYAHLTDIAPGIEPGAVVRTGDVIGHVGNSGTAAESNGTDYGLHLHTDILLYGQNVWLQFDPQTMRELMQEIIDN